MVSRTARKLRMVFYELTPLHQQFLYEGYTRLQSCLLKTPLVSMTKKITGLGRTEEVSWKERNQGLHTWGKVCFEI